MKLVVIGSAGQVGVELIRSCNIEGIDVVACNRQAVDLARPESIEPFFRREFKADAPDVVINAAAYTAVDRAESEPELAMLVNRDAPGELARCAGDLGARFIHISTDFVFDGLGKQPIVETQKANPINVYGRSKHEGELLVEAMNPEAVILRTSWVYSNQGNNFVKTMLRLASEREELRVVDDQYGGPTWARDIADVILALSRSELSGVFHFSGAGVVSWFEFARAAIDMASQLGHTVAVRDMFPIGTNEYPTPARRPAYSVLDNSKIENALGRAPVFWKTSLEKMIAKEVLSR